MAEETKIEKIRLTQFTEGGGCGCKIAPLDLEEILSHVPFGNNYDKLLLGNDTRDDAAIYDLGDGKALISTTDFFTPIVDDPEKFGRIAAVNAINDIYAMGGKPIMAIAILGWPIKRLPISEAGAVMRGGRAICQEAGIPLAGGHSIDNPDPIFGLAVNGIIDIDKVKYNNRAKVGDLLFLTKPLGAGIISTAIKKGKATPEDIALSENQMMQLNSIGMKLSEFDYVHSMTDVTGFGLGGHLIEMCEGSKVSARIKFDKVPVFPNDILLKYLEQSLFPGNTKKNFKSYGHKITPITGTRLQIICDPQTSGGLLLSIDSTYVNEFLRFMKDNGFSLESFGEIVSKGDKVIIVE